MNHFSYASKPHRSRDCRGKVRYRSHATVVSAAVDHYLTRGDRINHYRCDHCGWFHLGHHAGVFVVPAVWRAIDAAGTAPVVPSRFLASLRARTVAAADRACRPMDRERDELIAAVTGELPVPGLVDRLTAAQCEDVLTAIEATEQRRIRRGRGSRRECAA